MMMPHACICAHANVLRLLPADADLGVRTCLQTYKHIHIDLIQVEKYDNPCVCVYTYIYIYIYIYIPVSVNLLCTFPLISQVDVHDLVLTCPYTWQISYYTDSVVSSTTRESEQVCASIAVLGGALLRHKLSVHAVSLLLCMPRYKVSRILCVELIVSCWDVRFCAVRVPPQCVYRVYECRNIKKTCKKSMDLDAESSLKAVIQIHGSDGT